MTTRPCYTFHSSYSYLYYHILSCYMLSSCTFHILSSCTIRILHIHLYVLILSYTLCFRILSVLFLCWLKANTFISYLFFFFSYYVNFYLIFHISRRSTKLILLLSYHILSYVFTYAFMYFHILYCHIIYFHVLLYCISCSCNGILSSHSSAMLLISYHIIYFAYIFPLHILFIFFYVHACEYLRSGYGK